MFQRLDIPEVFVFTPRRFEDARGWFAETFNLPLMDSETGPLNWVQDNHSLSRPRHTLRGLHFQTPPFVQDKLVRCLSGRILDVAVDIRRGSPTYGRHVRAELTAARGEQIFVPGGFLHGFLTLEPDTEVAYKVTASYSAAHDRGVRWNDPALGIDWGLSDADIVLSDKDRSLPLLADLPPVFAYQG